MQKSISLFLLVVLAISIFAISNSFASPTTPTMYIAVGGCCVLVFLAIMQSYKQQTLCLSVSEALLGGFLLYAIVYGVIGGSLNPEWKAESEIDSLIVNELRKSKSEKLRSVLKIMKISHK